MKLINKLIKKAFCCDFFLNFLWKKHKEIMNCLENAGNEANSHTSPPQLRLTATFIFNLIQIHEQAKFMYPLKTAVIMRFGLIITYRI